MATPNKPTNPTTPDETATSAPVETNEQTDLEELVAAENRAAELRKKLGVHLGRGGATGGGRLGEIQALLRERQGYVQRDLGDRVSQVDEQLRLRGYRANEKTLEKDTAEAFAAVNPGMRVEDAVAEREARQTTR
jgi:uncharacterized protein (UPF0254 family)